MSRIVTATIANAASESNVLDLGPQVEAGLAIEMPAAWTAAAITVLSAADPGGTFLPVHDDAGTEISITTAASRVVGLGTELKARTMATLRFIKLRSGTTGVPVAQLGERILKVIVKA